MKDRVLAITLPTFLTSFISSLRKDSQPLVTQPLITHFAPQNTTDSSTSSSSSHSTSFRPVRNNSSFNNFKKYFKNSFFIPLGVIALIVVGLAIYLIRDASAPATVLGDEDQRVSVEKPKATQVLNKNYQFPLRDNSGKEVSKLKYLVLNTELRDQIIVKGKRATAVQGRTFLILNLKITNDFDRSVQINTKDYIRLVVNNSSEKLAPEIHNDPVEIQAISTKYTRLGFPIYDTDKDMTLQIGEINGKKENIKLNFSQ